jgi:hypothetical protein
MRDFNLKRPRAGKTPLAISGHSVGHGAFFNLFGGGSRPRQASSEAFDPRSAQGQAYKASLGEFQGAGQQGIGQLQQDVGGVQNAGSQNLQNAQALANQQMGVGSQLFGAQGQQQLGNIQGANLDVTKLPAYQALAQSLQSQAGATFNNLLDPSIRAQQASQGALTGSTTEQLRDRAAAGLASGVAAQLGQTGAALQSQQLSSQQQSALAAQGLGQQAFGQQGQLQQAQLQQQLAAAGLSEQDVQNYVNYLGLGRNVSSTAYGPNTTGAGIAGIVNPLGSIFGGKGG